MAGRHSAAVAFWPHGVHGEGEVPGELANRCTGAVGGLEIGELGAPPPEQPGEVRFRALSEGTRRFPNHDRVETGPGLAVVLDGAFTPIECGHTTSRYVSDLAPAAARHASDRDVSLAEAVALGIGEAAAEHRERCGDNPLSSPRSTVAIARANSDAGKLEAYTLADAAVMVLLADGTVDTLQDLRVERYSPWNPSVQRLAELRSDWAAGWVGSEPALRFPEGNWSGSPEDRRQFDQELKGFAEALAERRLPPGLAGFDRQVQTFLGWMKDQREATLRAVNNPDVEGGGFFVAAAKPQDAYQGLQREYPLGEVQAVAVMSDRGRELVTLMADARGELPSGMGRRPPYTDAHVMRLLGEGGVNYSGMRSAGRSTATPTACATPVVPRSPTSPSPSRTSDPHVAVRESWRKRCNELPAFGQLGVVLGGQGAEEPLRQ